MTGRGRGALYALTEEAKNEAGGGSAGAPPSAPAPAGERLARNLRESVVEAGIIFGVFCIVVLGRSVTDRSAAGVFSHADVYVWLCLMVFVSGYIKTYFPRLQDVMANAALFQIVAMLMAPVTRGL